MRGLRRAAGLSALLLGVSFGAASCGNLLGLSALHDGICDPGSTRPCTYHGTPAKTEGVGTCIAATQTCSGDGQSWSTCDGEVDPTAEVCGDNLDNDCDGVIDNGCPCMVGAMSACYDGPAGSADAGVCHGGMHVCNADGMTYGACTGQQLPAAEGCPATVDTNCDGFLCSQTKWATAFGTPVVDLGGGVGVDGSGNVYVAGSFGGEAAGVAVKIGNVQLITAGGADIFLAKFDPKGNVLWAKRYGDVGDESATSIAVDTTGNVVLTGYTTATVDFGGPSPVGGQVFVVKLDPSGKQIWATSCGGAAYDFINSSGQGVALDSQGDVVFSGIFGGMANCGDGAHNSAANDVLVGKLSRMDGQPVWTKSFGNGKTQFLGGLAVDATDNVFVDGLLPPSASLIFGSTTLSSPGLYVVRLSGSSGGVSWARSYGSNSAMFPGAVAVDSTGGPAIVGSYSASGIDLGGGVLPGSTGGFILKLDAGGTHQWSRGFSSGNTLSVSGVAFDANDNLGFAGTGTTDFGGGTVDGVFAGKLTNAGAHIWSRGFGAYGRGNVAFGPSVLAVVGWYQGTIDFGAGQFSSTGGGSVSDVFVAAFAP